LPERPNTEPANTAPPDTEPANTAPPNTAPPNTAPPNTVRPITLRAVAPSVYLPALIFEIGNGAIAPIIALTALAEGASTATAGFTLALLGIGQIIGDVPAGALADRLGDRRAMIVAAIVAMAALGGCYFSRSLIVLGLSLIVVGLATSTYYLGRQSYLTEIVPIELRARAMSTLGGSHRIGLFIGPFVGAAAIHFWGLRSVYLLAIVTSVAAVIFLIVVPDVPAPAGQPAAIRGAVSSWSMLRTYRRLFATLGFAVVFVAAVRAARQTVLPLWASHLGLGAEQTSLIFGIASAVDMALFYPSGKVMDHFGRLSIALPSMVILGGSMVLIPLTRGPISLTVVAMIMSFGNGIGSGIMMTLGADTAPADSRARFLAVWRLFSDSGNAAGPVVVSVVASATTLAVGIAAIGSVGLLAAGALALWVPRYSPFATRRAMRAARM
jgi:MFS family permease